MKTKAKLKDLSNYKQEIIIDFDVRKLSKYYMAWFKKLERIYSNDYEDIMQTVYLKLFIKIKKDKGKLLKYSNTQLYVYFIQYIKGLIHNFIVTKLRNANKIIPLDKVEYLLSDKRECKVEDVLLNKHMISQAIKIYTPYLALTKIEKLMFNSILLKTKFNYKKFKMLKATFYRKNKKIKYSVSQFLQTVRMQYA